MGKIGDKEAQRRAMREAGLGQTKLAMVLGSGDGSGTPTTILPDVLVQFEQPYPTPARPKLPQATLAEIERALRFYRKHRERQRLAAQRRRARGKST